MGSPRIITHKSDVATRLANAANFITPLISFKTPKGVTYAFPNPFSFEALKLYDGAGNQIPAESNLYMAIQPSGSEWETKIAKIPYSSFADLTESQQRDIDFKGTILFDLGQDSDGDDIPGYEIPEDDDLIFYIESPVVVDLNQSATRFEIKVSVD